MIEFVYENYEYEPVHFNHRTSPEQPPYTSPGRRLFPTESQSTEVACFAAKLHISAQITKLPENRAK